MNQVVTKSRRIVKALWWLHLTLRKFHRLTGMLGTGKANLDGVITMVDVVTWETSLGHVYQVSGCPSENQQSKDQG